MPTYTAMPSCSPPPPPPVPPFLPATKFGADANGGGGSLNTMLVVLLSVVFVLVILAAAFICFIRLREKRGKPIWIQFDGSVSAGVAAGHAKGKELGEGARA